MYGQGSYIPPALLNDQILEELISLRREIHRNPELSGNEKETADRIVSFANQFSPDQIIEGLGGYGVAVIYDSHKPGQTILLRADMDALPISEDNQIEYCSIENGISHLCGHDGHMVILAGLMPLLKAERPASGRVVLLFQPAEETGQGAAAVLKDLDEKEINPDQVYALHNIPGFNSGAIIIRENAFAAASRGMIIKLNGITSHAAEPEKGVNPALTACSIVQNVLALNEPLKNKTSCDQAFRLITLVGIKVGGRAFGTSAGDGEIMLTLRTESNSVMDELLHDVNEIIDKAVIGTSLKMSTEFVEIFPSVENDAESVKTISSAAEESDFELITLKEPFRWSEDFGHFTNRYQGSLFGLGSGESQPPLHNPAFDFPEKIIPVGVEMFINIIRRILR